MMAGHAAMAVSIPKTITLLFKDFKFESSYSSGMVSEGLSHAVLVPHGARRRYPHSHNT